MDIGGGREPVTDGRTAGPTQRVTVFVGENHHYHGRAAYQAVLEFLYYRRVAGATVTRGIAGFGADHRLHSSDLLVTSDNLPVTIEFVESSNKVQELLPKVRDMIGGGMITVQPTEVYFTASATKASPPPAHVGLRGAGKLMRIYVSEKDRWRDKPLHVALVESLRAHDMAGVTVYRGIAGYGAGARQRQEVSPGHGVPVMLSVVDTEEKVRNYLPLLDGMLTRGLVVLSDVEVIKYTHDAAGDPA